MRRKIENLMEVALINNRCASYNEHRKDTFARQSYQVPPLSPQPVVSNNIGSPLNASISSCRNKPNPSVLYMVGMRQKYKEKFY
jgi:hypothetical protein